MCRSRRELSNAYLVVLAKFGFDTAENEPSKVCPIEPNPTINISAGGAKRGDDPRARAAFHVGEKRPVRRTPLLLAETTGWVALGE